MCTEETLNCSGWLSVYVAPSSDYFSWLSPTMSSNTVDYSVPSTCCHTVNHPKCCGIKWQPFYYAHSLVIQGFGRCIARTACLCSTAFGTSAGNAWRLGTGIIWRLRHTHVWRVMLAVSQNTYMWSLCVGYFEVPQSMAAEFSEQMLQTTGSRSC